MDSPSMRLRVVRPQLVLRVLRPPPSPHMCYILRSSISNRVYIGYTVNFAQRLRKHNGEIAGGAKKTRTGRPWYPVCEIHGFFEASSALRFEYRLQHPKRKRRKGEDSTAHIVSILASLIASGDGSIAKDNKMPWPELTLKWHVPSYKIDHPRVINLTI